MCFIIAKYCAILNYYYFICYLFIYFAFIRSERLNVISCYITLCRKFDFFLQKKRQEICMKFCRESLVLFVGKRCTLN